MDPQGSWARTNPGASRVRTRPPLPARSSHAPSGEFLNLFLCCDNLPKDRYVPASPPFLGRGRGVIYVGAGPEESLGRGSVPRSPSARAARPVPAARTDGRGRGSPRGLPARCAPTQAEAEIQSPRLPPPLREGWGRRGTCWSVPLPRGDLARSRGARAGALCGAPTPLSPTPGAVPSESFPHQDPLTGAPNPGTRGPLPGRAPPPAPAPPTSH